MDPTNENENNASAISSDLIRGHINTIILRTLYDGDKYGYEIINEIEEKSKGQYSLKQPTLYSALKRLESQDYVTSYWGGVSNGGRRKYFQITDKGRQIVEQNLAEWEYSRTVIDSLISEKDYDFNNPPPSSLDMSLLKKSTTRVPRGGVGHDDIDLGAFDEESEDIHSEDGENEEIFAETEEENTDGQSEAATESADGEGGSSEQATQRFEDSVTYENLPYPAQTDRESLTASAETEIETAPQGEADAASHTAFEPSYRQEPEQPPARDPWIEEEQRRIQHENYRNLVGNEDATSYYYASVARSKSEVKTEEAPAEPASMQPQPTTTANEPQSAGYAPEEVYDAAYEENRAISSELLYSNRSPAERNYKELLSKLYDNSNPPPQEEPYYEEPYPAEESAPQPAPVQEPAPAPVQEPVRYADPAPAAATAGNVEFYDIEEQAENDGIRITTSNGAKNRTAAKQVGNTFDKGKALFMTALFVGAVALIECIVNLCIRNVIHSHPAYIILPFVATFVMFGVFLFLYLKGYGRNSRRTQSRSYISASLILFVDLIIVICLIAYFIISSGTGVTFTQVLKFAILPCIFVFNIPLFAILYNYNSSKQ